MASKRTSPHAWPELGRAIRIARQDAGVTQSALAAKVGIAREQLCGVEKGRLGIQTKDIAAIAEVLGLCVDDLVPRLRGPEPEAA